MCIKEINIKNNKDEINRNKTDRPTDATVTTVRLQIRVMKI